MQKMKANSVADLVKMAGRLHGNDAIKRAMILSSHQPSAQARKPGADRD
jgi:hypothetical protein